MRGLILWIRQVVAVTLFSLASIRQRLGSSLVTVAGIAGVVMVLVGVLSIASGFQRTLMTSGDPASVIVMRSGSDGEMTSGIGLEDSRIIADAPGIARTADGRPMVSSELYVVLDLTRRSGDTPSNVPLRGVDPELTYPVRGNVEIIEGRAFEAGRNEVIAGRGAAAAFAGLDVGSTIEVGQNEWTVVGIFAAEGTVIESEIWCDARVLQPAYRRSGFQSVYARLTSVDAFDELKETLTSDPRLDVKVERTNDFYSGQSSAFTTFIRVVGFLIGGLMGIGAIFGAVNTLYTAVASRSREIATLRALGFGASPVVLSVLFEAMVLAAAGGTLGALLAYVLFNGYQTATMNFQTFSQIAFAFAVTEDLMILGLVYALLMGLVGGLLPAIRAAVMPVASALRES